jgi:high-affinity iron transporter
MIYWMGTKGMELRTELERRVEDIATRGAILGLVSFSFIVVFREGLETVLFLVPFLLNDLFGTLIGALIGIVSSSVLAYAIYAIGMRIDMQRFFYFTSILLILLAGGLAGHGVHELAEYAEETGLELGWLGKYAYALKIPQGSPFHDEGVIGSVLAVMFGYTVKAEWIRVIVQVGYLLLLLPIVILIYRRQTDGEKTKPANGQ